MAKAPPKPVSPELIESWRARIKELDVLIAGDPVNQWCWLWQIRRDILAHLMHRYAGKTVHPTVPSPGAGAQSRPGQGIPDAATDAYIRLGSTPQQTHAGVKPPREGSQFRDRLASLHNANSARYAQAPRPVVGNRIIGITRRGLAPGHNERPLQYRARFSHALPAALTGVPGPLASQERALVSDQVQAIQQLINDAEFFVQGGHPLSEDQILAILQSDAPTLPGVDPATPQDNTP